MQRVLLSLIVGTIFISTTLFAEQKIFKIKRASSTTEISKMQNKSYNFAGIVYNFGSIDGEYIYGSDKNNISAISCFDASSAFNILCVTKLSDKMYGYGLIWDGINFNASYGSAYTTEYLVYQLLTNSSDIVNVTEVTTTSSSYNNSTLNEEFNKGYNQAKEDCKNNPEYCGINIASNSDLIYTQADLDTAKSLAKDEAKNECQSDPSSCGISTSTITSSQSNLSNLPSEATSTMSNETPPTIPTTQVHILVKEQIDNLSSGWHLVGTGSIISDMSIFSSARAIWIYENNTWIQDPNEIKELKGFWVLK